MAIARRYSLRSSPAHQAVDGLLRHCGLFTVWSRSTRKVRPLLSVMPSAFVLVYSTRLKSAPIARTSSTSE